VVEAPGLAATALPASEIRLTGESAFDYEGKYLGRGSVEITPAEVPPEVSAAAQNVALAAHRLIGCSGYSRTDVIAAEGGVYFLELNTLPGLTRASFIPQQLAAAGRSLEQFLDDQIALARARRNG
jgi:D-alanine-D-alanine ligase